MSIPPFFKDEILDTGEVKLHYIRGPKRKTPIILIPGQSDTAESYNKVMPLLSENFEVYAVDVRGHGKSSWTTGKYSFKIIGHDFERFIKEVVKKPVIISGNSSGGLIALYLASTKPKLVKAIILEDAPLFSADWPRIKNEFVYTVLKKTADNLGKKGGPDYKAFFKSIAVPEKGKDELKKLPKIIISILTWLMNNKDTGIGRIVTKILPVKLKRLVEIIPSFDPDFSRAWVDGRIYDGLNHEDALEKTKCPILILQADWWRHPKYGLFGAMDDDDAEKALKLSHNAEYERIYTSHVIHQSEPKKFAESIISFVKRNGGIL